MTRGYSRNARPPVGPKHEAFYDAIATVLGNGITLTPDDSVEIAPYYGFPAEGARLLLGNAIAKRALAARGVKRAQLAYSGRAVYHDGSIPLEETDIKVTKRIIDRSLQEKKQKEAEKVPPRKISLAETEQFERPGFTGHEYVTKTEGLGFAALQVNVHGAHPRKKMLDGTTRTYYVVGGEGTFTLGDETHAVAQGDLFVIPPEGEYEYEGVMTLLEMNISPDNSFKDQRIE